MSIPDIEKEIGIRAYSTNTLGIGGRIKEIPEDFIVEEILRDGSIATLHPTIPQKILGKGKFMTCILVKSGRDSLLTVKEIANRLGIHQRRISVGGIKDTRAMTSQFISIKKVPPSHVIRLDIPDVMISPQAFSKVAVNSKQLLGNRFTVKIRGIEETTEEVIESVNSTFSQIERHGGVPNFFGHQRFGTVRPISHIVGRLMVKGDFQGAVITFLSKYSGDERPHTRKARQELWETGDFEKALKEFPRGLVFERIMIRYLVENGRDYVGALRSLPVKFLRFLVQAYQSYLFNLTLSERIGKGLPLNSALPGDSILALDLQGLPEGEPTRVDEINLTKINTKIREGRAGLVIPLIGYNTMLSGGEEGIIEKTVLDGEGVQPKNFYLKEMLDISLAGSYRTALVKPRDVQATQVRDEGSKLSVTLAFWLPKGSYATLILREIMKSKNPIAANF